MRNIKEFENKVIKGDCIEVMKTIPDNSVDTVICDPPYELNFMGKGWDNQGIAFQKETWEEVLRVAKPGATLMAFGGTRTYHRLACAIEDAGWVIKDCIMWLYGSGFPKATDISKQLDKRAGKERKKILNPKAKQQTESKGTTDYGDYEATTHITPNPISDEAKLWNGWKSHGLKPAYEPIIVAQKPNDGTYANNALKWGVSGLNINEARIPTNEDLSVERNGNKKLDTHKQGWGFKAVSRGNEGRFPSNIILDEEAAEMLDEQSGDCRASGKYKQSGNTEWYGGKSEYKHTMFDDKGGASRFFKIIK